MSSLNNLAITATNSAMTSAMGKMFDTLQSKLANGGRDNNCKFYYSGPGASGNTTLVLTKSLAGGAVSALKDEAVNTFNSLFRKKKPSEIDGYSWNERQLKSEEKESQQYGKIQVDGGVVYALDDWGGISPDALMLSIELDKAIQISQTWPVYGTKIVNGVYQEKQPEQKVNVFTSKNLVWYDTTALITINSDKNLLATRVQGRDYSRKELISNGDIKFSVTGQITSGRPDVYPAEEIQKFIKVMQYKGIVKINNQVLDQFGITHIVITDFNISPREGYKALQNYTFSAIGLQPESEKEIPNDTITIETQKVVESKKTDENEWLAMLNNQLDGLKSMAQDMFSQGAALGTGLLEKQLDKKLD